MELTGEQVVGSTMVLNQISTQGLPVKTSLKLRRVKKSLQPEAENFDELRQEKLKEYAIKDEDGNPVKDSEGNFDFEDDAQEELEDELQQLFETTIEVNGLRPVKLSELSDELEIAPLQLDILMNAGIFVED